MFQRNFFLAAMLMLFALIAKAQSIGIGTATPDPSAALEIKNTNKGLLIPRVNLISANDNSTVPSPANSLLVFNTNATMPNGVGYYFNNGSSVSPSWKALNAGNFSLPYSATFSSASSLFSLYNNSTGYAGEFISNNTGSAAALKASTASTQSNSAAIHGTSGSSGLSINFKTGILGESNGTGAGITGMSQAGDGVYGLANAQSKAGVHGRTDVNFGYGVLGQSFGNGTGGFFSSTTGRALVTDGVVQMNNTGATLGKVLMTDINGHAHWEGGVSFSAAYDTTVLPVNGGLVVPFNKEEFDVSSNFNTWSGFINPNTFIAPVAGIYRFDARIYWQGDPSSLLGVWLVKNIDGVEFAVGRYDDYGGFFTYSNRIVLSTTLKLNAGDKIRIEASSQISVPTYLNQTITGAYFSGTFLMKQ